MQYLIETRKDKRPCRLTGCVMITATVASHGIQSQGHTKREAIARVQRRVRDEVKDTKYSWFVTHNRY